VSKNYSSLEAQCLIFSQKDMELIKHRGDKRITYNVIPLNWGINKYDVYNINRLIETVLFYTVRPFFVRSAPPSRGVGDGMRKKDTEIPPKRAFV
jgi:hypothetical protein